MAKQYRALIAGLTYPTDSRVIRRISSGEDVPMADRKMCEPHVIGDILTDIPGRSIHGLIGAGWIEEVNDDETG